MAQPSWVTWGLAERAGVGRGAVQTEVAAGEAGVGAGAEPTYWPWCGGSSVVFVPLSSSVLSVSLFFCTEFESLCIFPVSIHRV